MERRDCNSHAHLITNKRQIIYMKLANYSALFVIKTDIPESFNSL